MNYTTEHMRKLAYEMSNCDYLPVRNLIDLKTEHYLQHYRSKREVNKRIPKRRWQLYPLHALVGSLL